jgi:hypothetical protein
VNSELEAALTQFVGLQVYFESAKLNNTRGFGLARHHTPFPQAHIAKAPEIIPAIFGLITMYSEFDL